MSKSQEIFEQGLLPLDEESEEEFCKRAEDILHYREKNNLLTPHNSPYLLYFYSKKQLRAWEGAAFFYDPTLPSFGYIQINPLIQKGILKHLYTEEELLNHEKVHAQRASFEMSPYEELLAYATSPYPLRRVLGPLFSSTQETLFFLFLVVFSLLLEVICFIFDFPLYLLQLVAALPFLYLLFLSLRLFLTFRRFNLCKKKLLLLIKDPKKIFSLLLCLKGEEIASFSQLSQEEMNGQIAQKEKTSLRWKLIKACYLT